MKDVKFFFMGSIAVRRWMYYVPFLLICANFITLLFESKSVEYTVQLIIWAIHILCFLFTIAVIIKDNIELNKNKETNISLFYCFLTVLFFFQFLIWTPMMSGANKLVDVLSFFN